MTSKTGALAVDIAGDKDLTRQAARVGRAPGAASRRSVRTADGAMDAAERIGYPVVVKPLDGNHGRGVCLDLQSRGRRRARLRHRRGESQARHRHRRVLRDRPRLPLPHRRRHGCRPSPSASLPTSSATASTPCPSWSRSPTPTRGAVSVTRRCSPRSRSTPRPRRCCADQGTRLDVGAARRTRWSSSPSPATCRPAASRSTAPSTRTRTTSRSPRRRPGWSGSTSRASTSSAPTSPPRSARPAAPSVEVNAAPGFRMHTHPTVGEPQFIAKPVVDLLFPPGRPVARADRRGHRHQRQDDDVADDRPHLQGARPQGRHDVDRRHRHRRAAGHQGRRLRAASRRGWSCRTRASTSR